MDDPGILKPIKSSKFMQYKNSEHRQTQSTYLNQKIENLTLKSPDKSRMRPELTKLVVQSGLAASRAVSVPNNLNEILKRQPEATPAIEVENSYTESNLKRVTQDDLNHEKHNLYRCSQHTDLTNLQTSDTNKNSTDNDINNMKSKTQTVQNTKNKNKNLKESEDAIDFKPNLGSKILPCSEATTANTNVDPPITYIQINKDTNLDQIFQENKKLVKINEEMIKIEDEKLIDGKGLPAYLNTNIYLGKPPSKLAAMATKQGCENNLGV